MLIFIACLLFAIFLKLIGRSTKQRKYVTFQKQIFVSQSPAPIPPTQEKGNWQNLTQSHPCGVRCVKDIYIFNGHTGIDLVLIENHYSV